MGRISADAADIDGFVEFLARNGIWIAAILTTAGFFFAATGRGRTTPNGFIGLIYLGALSLAIGVVSLGIGPLRA